MEVLTIAMDLGGAGRVRPYVEAAAATFATAVDADNLLGQLYGFKAVPNGFLLDATGVVRYMALGGFDIRRPETAALLGTWASTGEVADGGGATDSGLGSNHARAIACFRRGLRLYRAGRLDTALAEWRRAVALEPDNYIIRKQIWAIESPDRFYGDAVDYDWQAEQLGRGA